MKFIVVKTNRFTTKTRYLAKFISCYRNLCHHSTPLYCDILTNKEIYMLKLIFILKYRLLHTCICKMDKHQKDTLPYL